MPSNPLQIVLVVVLVLGVLGIVISIVTSRLKFAHFEYLADSAKDIARSLKGEVSRAGTDLLIRGVFHGAPTFVRFSNGKGKPGLSIQMRAPVSFAFSATPARTAIPEPTRTVMQTGEAPFDDRVTISTDQPTLATLLLTRGNFNHVQKLCCSNQTFLHLLPGEINLTENVIPATQTWQHVMLHVESMKALADAMELIPGSEKIIVPPFERDFQIPGRIAIAVGVLAAIIVVIGSSSTATKPVAPPQPFVPAGMAPNDALQVHNLENWRLVTADDFNPDTAGWIRSYGIEPSGVIRGDFSGLGHNTDVAYVLVDKARRFRLIIVANHVNRYDSEFDAPAAVTRFPKASANTITWNGPAPRPITADGVLIVRDADDRASGVALFLSRGRLLSGAPADYQAVPLQ